MYNEQAVAQFHELVKLLEGMPIPTVKRDLEKQVNIRWLRRFIKPEDKKAKRVLEILKLCDDKDPQYNAGFSPLWQEALRKSYADRDQMIKRYLKKHNLEVTSNSWPGHPPKVYAVKLDFTAEEWVDLMSTEGEFLPACCATISHIRNILIGCMREGGFILATDLCEIVQLLKDHNDCDATGVDHPQARLVRIWETIKDDAELHLLGCPENLNDLDNAFHILYGAASVLSWNLLNHDATEDEKFDHEMVRQIEFIRVLPAIRTVYKELAENQDKIVPFEGYAVVDDKSNDILDLRRGFAIFRTKERAEEVAKMFNEREIEKSKKHKKAKEWMYKVKKVYVNLKDGLQVE